MRRGATALSACAIAIGLAVGCGMDDRASEQPTTKRETADAAVSPPDGWRTVTDATAGFTIAAPRSWASRRRDTSTLIRSADNAVAVTIVADRSSEGRQSRPPMYARRIVSQLPGFEGSIADGERKVAGSPYDTAIVGATGRIKGGARRQRVTVAVFNRPQLVTYAVVVLEDARSREGRNDQIVARMLRTLRARPPTQGS